MILLTRLRDHHDRHLLAYRLLLYILICSSFFALLSSAVQLYLSYRSELEPVESNFQFIHDNYTQDIAASVYSGDSKQLKVLLLGALQLEHIEYMDVRALKGSKEFIAFEGNPNVRKGILRTIPLNYERSPGEIISLGTLTVAASVQDVYKRLWEQTKILLVTNSLKTFFSSFCILLIFQLILTRHLGNIAHFSRSLDLNKLNRILLLNRKKSKRGKADELEQVVIAFNDMLKRIRDDVSAIKETEQKLRRSEQQYRILVETMNDSLVVVDPDALIVYVNDKCSDMLGYPKEELLGRPFIDFFAEGSRNVFEEQFALRKKGEKQGFYEASFISKSRNEIHAIVSSTRIPDAGGGFGGSFGIITDITRRKQMELELQSAFAKIKELKDRLEAENIYLRKQIEINYAHEGIVGQSDPLKIVLRQAEQVAETSSTVLILGETGTGKELIARTIHKLSARKKRTMVKVNCAALPSTLIESELFGREKGAYTGALSRQNGRFEIADGSTIFLDEIGELPLELQGKLLRVLQDGKFERLGSTKTIKVDVRIIAATNKDLEKAVRKGAFREDLYYRLNVFPIAVPSLRERSEDIPLLAQAFIKEFEETMGKRIDQILEKDMMAMQCYSWPGNVRELKNVIEHAMIITKGKTLELDMPGLPPH